MCGVILVRRWIRFRISVETLSRMGLLAKRRDAMGPMWSLYWDLCNHMNRYHSAVNWWVAPQVVRECKRRRFGAHVYEIWWNAYPPWRCILRLEIYQCIYFFMIMFSVWSLLRSEHCYSCGGFFPPPSALEMKLSWVECCDLQTQNLNANQTKRLPLLFGKKSGVTWFPSNQPGLLTAWIAAGCDKEMCTFTTIIIKK